MNKISRKNISFYGLNRVCQVLRFLVFSALLVPNTPCQAQLLPLEKRLSGALAVREVNDEYKECLKKADYLIGEYEFEKSNEYCKLMLKQEPEDFLAKAMMCLNYYEIAEQLDVKNKKDKKEKREIYKEMIRVAEEGIKCAPDRGECYYMRGLANARISTTEGIFSSVFRAKGIERDWLEAVRHKSDYTSPRGENLENSANLALGIYYRVCPTFFLLKLFFGISGDLDKSIEYCRKAYEEDPYKGIEITKELGISLISRGLKRNNGKDIEEGKEYLRKVKTLPLRLKTDSIDKEHSEILLNDISLCPGYSRDQQQDISEESFKKIIK